MESKVNIRCLLCIEERRGLLNHIHLCTCAHLRINLPLLLAGQYRALVMSKAKQPGPTSNLKIGDTVLLYYNADNIFSTHKEGESGYILGDLSGYVGL